MKELYYIEFEKLVKALLEGLKYTVARDTHRQGAKYDYIIQSKELRIAVEVKFSWSGSLATSLLLRASKNLAHKVKQDARVNIAILIASSIVPVKTKNEIENKTGVLIWDRSNILDISSVNLSLRTKFEKLFNSINQLSDKPSFPVEKTATEVDKLKQERVLKGRQQAKKGEKICKALKKIETGKAGWKKFETKIQEALVYIFENDLSQWSRQERTDDGLNRFDLICRISSSNDYWTSLSRYFHTRYILFEMKNYKDKIKQGQIYTTEKYLFKTALRGVGYIIARNDADENALKAAKGALREHGKLLQILNLDEVCKMLKLKDENEDPNNVLAEKLDKFLIELSR